MATSYTTLLGLALPVQGELQGTWGNVVNNSITNLLDTAVAGTTTLSTDVDVTLSTTTGSANQARQQVILWTAGGTVTRYITAPAQSKTYVVINKTSSTQSIVLRGVGPTTGVTILKDEQAVVAWNGVDFVKVSTFGGSPSFTNVTVTGTTTLSGLTASTALALNASKEVVSVTNTGTGNNVLSASPTLTGTVAGASMTLSSLTSGRVTYAGASGLLQDSANLTFNGTDLTVSGAVNAGSINATTLDLTNLEVTNIKAKDGTASMTLADATGVASFSANPVLSAGTANGVTYLNGSKVLTTGSALTYNGTNLGLDAGGGAGPAYLEVSQRSRFGYDGTNVLISDAGTGKDIVFTRITEQMRLTSTGLGIGTSSPISYARLTLEKSGGDSAIALVKTGGAQTAYIAADGTNAWIGSSFGTTGKKFFVSLTAPDSAATLDSSGNLGIGTSSPASNLDIRGSSSRIRLDGSSASFQILSRNTADSTTNPLTFDADTYTFNRAGTTQLTLDASGNLGLGVTPSGWGSSQKAAQVGLLGLMYNPSSSTNSTLTHNAYYDGTNWRYILSSVAAARYEMTGANSPGSTHSWSVSAGGTAGNAISFTQAMTLDASGNLGIGTSSPSNKLTVSGTGTSALVAITNSSSFTGGTNFTAPHLFVNSGNDTTGNVTRFAMGIGTGGQVYLDALMEDGVTVYSSLLFRTRGVDGVAERMRLDSSGNLGIGTSSPSLKLDVNGSAKFAGSYVSFNDNGYIRTDAANILRFQPGSGGYEFRNASNSDNLAVLDASGNLGLGVTPSAWGSGFKAFEVGRVGSGLFSVGSTSMQVTNNYYYNGSNYIYSANGAATRYHLVDGQHEWYTAPSGTAGNTISFTQAMTLDASGNLGIGTTSTSLARLAVAYSASTYSTIGTFTNTSTNTAGYCAVTFGQGASGSAIGIIGTGGSTAGNAAFQNTFVVGAQSNNPLVFVTNDTERARITSGGDLLVGTTSTTFSVTKAEFVASGTNNCIGAKVDNASYTPLMSWNASTTGDSNFAYFYTEGTLTARGSITYNRAGGLTSYNTTSDYRAKDIFGPVSNSGATIDALKVYEGQMKGATQSRPMLVAHEAQAVAPYSVTGEKDAVNDNGDPVFQQMDVSSLVPLLIAEIQSLRARVAQLETKG